MAITAARKARYQARITQLEKNLESLYSIQDNFDSVESYKFDSGEGSQQTKFRSISDVMKAISRTEASIDRYYRLLNGTAIVNMNLRRSPCAYGRY